MILHGIGFVNIFSHIYPQEDSGCSGCRCSSGLITCFCRAMRKGV